MKGFVAGIIGFFSGLLISLMVLMLALDVSAQSGPPSRALVPLTLVGGWIGSGFLLVRGAQTVSGVFRRGLLLGAAEWLTMALVGLIFGGKITSATMGTIPDSGAATTGVAVGGGIAAVLMGGFAVFMSVACLIGFAIAYFMGREMRDRSGTLTRKCPECAEMIQAEARKCRYCGATIMASSAEAAGSSGP